MMVRRRRRRRIIARLVLQSLLPNVWLVAGLMAVPTVIFGFLFIRHAKAIYLAIDHYFDPHIRPAKGTAEEFQERMR